MWNLRYGTCRHQFFTSHVGHEFTENHTYMNSLLTPHTLQNRTGSGVSWMVVPPIKNVAKIQPPSENRPRDLSTLMVTGWTLSTTRQQVDGRWHIRDLYVTCPHIDGDRLKPVHYPWTLWRWQVWRFHSLTTHWHSDRLEPARDLSMCWWWHFRDPFTTCSRIYSDRLQPVHDLSTHSRWQSRNSFTICLHVEGDRL